MSRPKPPPGFTLDDEDEQAPAPPAGFTLDQPVPAPERTAPRRSRPAPPIEVPRLGGEVAGAIDGDTLDMRAGNNVRIWGVDAPELRQPGWNRQGQEVAIGEQSLADLNTILDRARTAVGAPVSSSHGRPVAPATADGVDLGLTLARQGSALAAPRYLASDPQRRHEYMQAERLARLNALGVHDTMFQQPEDFRRSPMQAPGSETVARFFDTPTPLAGMRPDAEKQYLAMLNDHSVDPATIADFARAQGFTIDPANVLKVRAQSRASGLPIEIGYKEAPRPLTDSGDGALGAGVRGAGSGAFAGGLDELGAFVDMAGLTPNRENVWNSDRRLADIWANNQQQNSAILGYDRFAHPGAELAGEIAGGILVPFGAKARTIPQLARVGGMYGAAQGFLGTEGGPGERAVNSVIGVPVGAATGAVVGKALEGAMRYAPRLAGSMGIPLPRRAPAPSGGEFGGIPAVDDILAPQAPSRSRDVIDIGDIPPPPPGYSVDAPAVSTSYPGPANGRARDWIDVGQFQPRPMAMDDGSVASISQAMRQRDYLNMGASRPRPLTEPMSFDQMRAAAADVQPADLLPIPSNQVGSVDEAARIDAGRYGAARAPNERTELTQRTVRAWNGAEVPKAGPIDMVGFLRLNGGLRDQGGELSHMGLDNRGRSMDFAGQETRFGPLVNEQGMNLDDAAERAWEAGYFPDHAERPSVNDFLNALRDTHEGRNRRFLPEDFAEIDRFNAARQERYDLQEQRFTDGKVWADKSAPADERPFPPVQAYEEWPAGGPDFAGNIDLRKLETPQDIARALNTVSQRFPFDAATRGRVTWAETERLASDLNMTPDGLLSRRQGQAFNAEEALAARQILAKSGNEIVNLARRVRSMETPGDDALAEFRQALVRHVAIQEQVSGMTAEAGRVLQQFRQTADSRVVRGDVLAGLVQSGGGRKRLVNAAEAILEATEESPGKFNAVVEKLAQPRWQDKAIELMYIFKLSRPSTHVVNVVSNALTALAQVPEHALASGIGKVRQGALAAGARLPGRIGASARDAQDDMDRVIGSEVGARAFGLLEGFREGLPEMVRAFKTGESRDFITRLEQQHEKALPGKAGHVARIPLRALMAEDELFKAMARRMEINGQAVRIANRDGLKGQAAVARIAELKANPTDEMLQQAMEYGRYLTFQTQLGDVGRGVQQAKQNSVTLTGLFPFIRTPINLVKFAAERSPLAPALGRWREDFNAGGARRDLALAKMLVGTAAAASIYQAAQDGHISGGRPLDPKKAQFMSADGWQPYSFRVGDKFYSFSRLDPFATTLGVAADLATRQDGMSERQREDYAMQLSASIISNMSDKVWLSSASDLLQAINDWPRYGESFVRSFVAGTVVPAASTGIKQTIDPVSRDAQSVPEAIQSRIPGLAQDLPARRNIWGEPITYDSVGPALTSPMAESTARHDPVNAEMLAIGARFDAPDRWYKQDGKRIDLTPQEYERYAELSGRGTRQRIEALMADPSWQTLTIKQRADKVSDAAKLAKAEARAELFNVEAPRKGLASAPRKKAVVPAPPPGFTMDGAAGGVNIYGELQRLIPGVQFTSGFRTPEYQADMRRRGYKPAANSGHLDGSALDMLPPPGRSMEWLRGQVQRQYPDARLLIHDGHLHATFPGYYGAPVLGGARGRGIRNPNAGMPPPPPGYKIDRR